MVLKCDCRVWCCDGYMAATLVKNPTPSALPAIVSDPAFADRPDWSLNIYRARLAPAPTGRIEPEPKPNRAEVAPRPAKAASPSRAWRPLRDIGLCCHRCSLRRRIWSSYFRLSDSYRLSCGRTGSSAARTGCIQSDGQCCSCRANHRVSWGRRLYCISSQRPTSRATVDGDRSSCFQQHLQCQL